MATMSDLYEKMELYLQGTLSVRDQREFEELLRLDDVLATEFEIYKKVRKSVIRQSQAEPGSQQFRRTLADRDRRYVSNYRHRILVRWLVLFGSVVLLTVVLIWSPWNVRAVIEENAGPCFDYDFTEGPLDTTIWEIMDIRPDGQYSQSGGYLKIETGPAGGHVTIRLKNYSFEGDLDGIIELGSVTAVDSLGRGCRLDFTVNVNNLWQVPEISSVLARNRLLFENNGRDLITDYVGQWFPLKKFYKFQRIENTFILSHSDLRNGPYTEMERFTDPKFFSKFNYFEITAGAKDDLGPVLYEIGRITIFKGCVLE